jgi:hypothetical protein
MPILFVLRQDLAIEDFELMGSSDPLNSASRVAENRHESQCSAELGTFGN